MLRNNKQGSDEILPHTSDFVSVLVSVGPAGVATPEPAEEPTTPTSAKPNRRKQCLMPRGSPPPAKRPAPVVPSSRPYVKIAPKPLCFPTPKTVRLPAPKHYVKIAPKQEPGACHPSTLTSTVLIEVWDKNIATVEALLDNDAQVNRSENCNDSPLTVASSNNDVHMVQLLLKRGADVQETDGEGITPLMHAASHGHKDVVSILLEAGANVEACNGKEETALMLACAQDRKEVIGALITAGSNREQTDEDGYTPLMIAANRGHICTVTLLLSYGTNVNARSRTGDTPLSLAYEGGHLTLCELLLAHGAHPRVFKAGVTSHYCRPAGWEKHSLLSKVLGKQRHGIKDAKSQTEWSIPINKGEDQIMIPVFLDKARGLNSILRSLYAYDRKHRPNERDRETPEFRQWPRGTSLDSKTKHVVMNVLHHVMKSNSNLGMTDAGAITSEITGVSVRSMLRYSKQMKKNEGEVLPEPSKNKTRKGKPRNARTYKYDDITISVVRNKIHTFFTKNEIPSIDKVLAAVQADTQLPDLKRATIYRLICDLGFKYRKLSRKSILIDREDIILWRRRYLQLIKEYRSANRPIVYVDETWCDAGHCQRHVWEPGVTSLLEALQLGMTTGMTQPTGKEQRVVLTHAGNEHGFVDGACDMYVSEYHIEMTGQYFEDWFAAKLLPKLEPGTVIVLDSAPCHSAQQEKRPDKGWPLQDVRDWLTSKGLQWREDMLKHELLEVADPHCEALSQYRIDRIAEAVSVKVLRLPPYHCLLNPIALVWAWVKRKVALENKTLQINDVKALAEKAVDAVTPDMWASCMRHVVAEEDKLVELDGLTESLMAQLRMRSNGAASSAESGPEDNELSDTETGTDSCDRQSSDVLMMSRIEALINS